MRELAARRVHQGVEFDVFLHAYRVALFAFWDACAEEAERLRLPRSAGYALARAAIEAIDLVTTQAAEGFLREETRVRTRSGREARDLVERLLVGRPPDPRRRHPAAPGLDPTATLSVLVGRVEAADQLPGDALLVARDVLAERLGPPLITLRHGELVAITRAVRDADLLAVRAVAPAHGIDVRFGLGLPSAGFAGVERAYHEAILCLARATPMRPVVLLRDLPALETAMAGTDATARAVIAAKGTELRALDPSDRAIAIDTIRAFAAADLNVARAATALHVHQNTVRHRLDRINATTGHDPRTFRGLADLLCAAETLQDGSGQAAEMKLTPPAPLRARQAPAQIAGLVPKQQSCSTRSPRLLGSPQVSRRRRTGPCRGADTARRGSGRRLLLKAERCIDVGLSSPLVTRATIS